MTAPTKKEMENKSRLEIAQMLLDGTYAQCARDELYKRAGKDGAANYLVNENNQQTQSKNGQKNKQHEDRVWTTEELMAVKPRVLIQTKPGTLGEIFDTWLEAGWDCANMIDAGHPYGQMKALEAIRGYDEIGAPANDMRDQTLETLSPDRAKYYSMLKDRFKDRFKRR